MLLLDLLVGELWAEDVSLLPMQNFIIMLAFGWLAFRVDRWWPIAVTALLGLCVLVRIIGMANPDLSRFAMISALLGFWIVIYLVVLAGVVERWLAGEDSVSGGKTWRRRDQDKSDGHPDGPEAAA